MSNEEREFIPERNHGYGDSPKAFGVPVIVSGGPPQGCPNCGCKKVFQISVTVEAPPQLRVPEGFEAFCVYIGCPACPWASPAINSSRPKAKGGATL